MSNNWKLALIVLAIVCGLSATLVFVASRHHAQRQTAAMTLIRDMDRIDQRLSQASREFGLALQQYLASGAEADFGAVRQTHRALQQSVSQAIAVVSRLAGPESEHGAAFISAQRKFLLVQRGIIREDFGRLLRLLEDTNVPQPERLTSINDIMESAYAETEKEFALVAAARDQFSREFAIRLMTQP